MRNRTPSRAAGRRHRVARTPASSVADVPFVASDGSDGLEASDATDATHATDALDASEATDASSAKCVRDRASPADGHRRLPVLAAAFATLAAALAVTPARADLDVTIGNGDVVRGSLLPADEAETFRFTCPPGATIRVDARTVVNRAPVAIRLVGPGETEAGAHAGRSARISAVAAASGQGGESSDHKIVVTTPAGSLVRTYSLSLRWSVPRRVDATATLASAATSEIAFSADAGARITLRATAPRKSAAVPVLVSLRAPDGTVTTLPPGPLHSFVADAAGSWGATFRNDGAAEDEISARADVRPPKSKRRTLSATTKEIPPDAGIVASAVMGSAGGRLDAPAGGPLDGVSVTFPPGALRKTSIVVLGAISDVRPPSTFRVAPGSASAFVGPAGVSFSAAAPTLRLPVTTAPGSPQAWTLRAFVPGARGEVAPLAPTTLAAGDGVLDVELRRLTAVQAWQVHAPWSPVPQVLSGSGAGGAVALGAGAAFVGQLDAAGGGLANSGQVATFRQSGANWIAGALLTAPDAALGDRFGWRVAFRPSSGVGDADSVLISAPYRANGTDLYDGAVYEFTRYGFSWLYRTTILCPAPTRGDAFGYLLAVDGDRLAVGASYETSGAAVYPGVFTFHRTTTGWEFDGEVSLETSPPHLTSLAASGGLLVGGSPTARGGGSGIVYPVAFPWTTNPAAAIVGAAGAVSGDAYGTEVATSGALVVANGFLTGAASGDVTVDRRVGSTWLREAVLTPDAESAALSTYGFGSGLAAAGDRVFSGTATQHGTWVHRHDPSGPSWYPEFLLADPFVVPAGDSFYGGPVAVDGATVMTLANLYRGTSATAYGFRVAFFELPEE